MNKFFVKNENEILSKIIDKSNDEIVEFLGLTFAGDLTMDSTLTSLKYKLSNFIKMNK